LLNTDFAMNNVFWIGVYPGLTKPMLDFVAETMTEFASNPGLHGLAKRVSIT
jgi:CDP-6-deoxy-D-xylo-4-hexulose-3-dehydrase